MKRTLIFILIAITGIWAYGQDHTQDEQSIRKTIQTSYVDGIQNQGEIADIQKGFHPGFELLGIRNNSLTKFPIYSWIEVVENRKKKSEEEDAASQKVTAKFPLIDVTGNAAIAKVEVYRGDEKLFTDYLSLYKFEEGWKIVSKIYHRHEKGN